MQFRNHQGVVEGGCTCFACLAEIEVTLADSCCSDIRVLIVASAYGFKPVSQSTDPRTVVLARTDPLIVQGAID